MNKPKIVVIGGGTGLSVLLRGLKTFPVDITAIVTVADDGGSSGILRKELNIPPPGDVRNVLVALAEVEPMIEQMFQHRFENGNGLSGHSLGNLLLAGMTSITGDFSRGISELSTVLNVRGNVFPAANQSIELKAEMTDGSIVTGESNIPHSGKQIKKVRLSPKGVQPLPESLEAIKQADLIVLGPGSLYTSVIPNLLVPGIAKAIQEASARKVYICNGMTQSGETDHFSVADHVEAIRSHTGCNVIDTVLVNNSEIPAEVLDKYAKESAFPVHFDEQRLEDLGYSVVKDAFMHYHGDLFRHDAVKVSQSLLKEL
ncbi:putative cofD-like protein [Salibacterium salarium]|uniref:gluconeogenesis factor YvcK family protein n=1 Tax=Salibacterium salarium TaxID=284579 RepID=UPI00277F1CA2|nr:YvcK family protein [Salibacterium salarium]MDQ0298304.1 putative cofD-like protein [Salibacterium salarium]